MRTIHFVTAAALLVASLEARAQTPPTKPEPPAVPSLGELDLGYRGGTVSGDEARFEDVVIRVETMEDLGVGEVSLALPPREADSPFTEWDMAEHE